MCYTLFTTVLILRNLTSDPRCADSNPPGVPPNFQCCYEGVIVSSFPHHTEGVRQARNIAYRGVGMVWASFEIKFRKELGETKPEARLALLSEIMFGHER